MISLTKSVIQYPRYLEKSKSRLKKHSVKTGNSTGLIKDCLII